MAGSARTSLDMRGKTITTFIAYETLRQLGGLADGNSLELVADASEAIDNDIRAWCRTRGQDLAVAGHVDGSQRYVITKRPPCPSGNRYATVVSDAGLEELLSPLPSPWPRPWRAAVSRCTSRTGGTRPGQGLH
jgi:TusA-related sulfurtransferase